MAFVAVVHHFWLFFYKVEKVHQVEPVEVSMLLDLSLKAFTKINFTPEVPFYCSENFIFKLRALYDSSPCLFRRDFQLPTS